MTDKQCCEKCLERVTDRLGMISHTFNRCSDHNCPCHTAPTDWRERFDAEFMEYAYENENTLIDNDTDGDKIKNFIHSLLEDNTRRVREEDLERAWDYVVEATRRESWGKAELKEALNPNTPT